MDPNMAIMHPTGPVMHPVSLMHPRRGKNPKHTMTSTITLAEEAKLVYSQEMSGINSKTPVSVLQELLSRRGSTPKYELVQIEGAIHEPVFRYRVFLSNDLVATGTGRSKKDAKHAAAKNLLDLIVGKQTPEQANQTNGTPGSNDITAQVVSPFDDKVMGNPIGWLQEMCMSRRWPPPLYEMEHEEGLPHERQFTIACQVLKFREVGTGKSKKLAKRVAAHRMWQALQDLPIEGTNPQAFESDEELGGNAVDVSARYIGLKDSKITKLSSQQSQKVSQFHKGLKQSAGKKLNELQYLDLKEFSFVQFLQEIASEQNFEVTFVDVEEKSLGGQCQCLVQLSTLPVAVCFGTGKTPKDARSNAALNALEYLKIMTKNLMKRSDFAPETARTRRPRENMYVKEENDEWFFTSYTLHRISVFFVDNNE
ncbi:RISC-loading complex subunit tarbp2-like [Cylas formicarius]|uniref:RISC-loading complex subunit tarbp2-like n=1 Tax=Cylas formicarius TaxID=197179 RepID=UPI0029588F2F|nr:RISC-loading complex subunit tarbp2-like [Cylas formicarius]